VHIKPRRQLRVFNLATGEEVDIVTTPVDSVTIYSGNSLVTVDSEQQAASIYTRQSLLLSRIEYIHAHNQAAYP
jgi:hypothetical protein